MLSAPLCAGGAARSYCSPGDSPLRPHHAQRVWPGSCCILTLVIGLAVRRGDGDSFLGVGTAAPERKVLAPVFLFWGKFLAPNEVELNMSEGSEVFRNLAKISGDIYLEDAHTHTHTHVCVYMFVYDKSYTYNVICIWFSQLGPDLGIIELPQLSI